MQSEAPLEFFTQPITTQTSRRTSLIHIEKLNNSMIKKIAEGKFTIELNQDHENPQTKIKRQKQAYSVKLRKSLEQKDELESKLRQLRGQIRQLKYLSVKDIRGSRDKNVDSGAKMKQIRREQEKQKLNLSLKKSIEIQRHKIKHGRQKEMMYDRRRQQIKERKHSIEDRIDLLRINATKREQFHEESNKKIKTMLRNQRQQKLILHPFEITQQEQNKKIILMRKQKYKPMNNLQLEEHQERFQEYMRQKQQQWKHQSHLIRRSIPHYRPSYQSRHKSQQQKQEQQRINFQQRMELLKRQRIKKGREYGQKVKDEYKPEINHKLQKQILKRIRKQQQKLKTVESKKEQSEKLIKIKGEKYLDYVKLLPKKYSKPTLVTQMTNEEDQRHHYKNYLIHTQRRQSYKWDNFKQDEKGQIRMDRLKEQSRKMQEDLKRKEQEHRLIGRKSEDQLSKIDEQYYQMMKAKLNVLESSR